MAAVVERPLGQDFAVEIVSGIRVIEVAGETEGALVERHHECLHRVVTGGVAAGQADLRPEGSFSLLDAGTGGIDVLLGSGEVGIVFQREPDRLCQAEWPGGIFRSRTRHNQRSQQNWEKPFHCLWQQESLASVLGLQQPEPPTPSFFKISSIKHHLVMPA